MMELDELRKNALKVVEADMIRYQDAINNLDDMADHQCGLKDMCSKCSRWHYYASVIQGICNKYHVL